MNLSKLVLSKFSLSLTRTKKYFPDYLRGLFDNYINNIRGLSNPSMMGLDLQNDLNNIEFLSNQIVDTIIKYYEGAPFDAYKTLETTLNSKKIKPHFLKIKSNPITFKNKICLYRARISDTSNLIGYSNKEMFHIPFNLRHVISTQRYSIPGFPSLYCGSSAYICWKELGCPDFDNVYMSFLEPQDKLEIIDFGYKPQVFASNYAVLMDYNGIQKTPLYQLIYSNLILWPLIAACSLKVLHKKSPFKPEYILPQLVLQYIQRNKAVDGIRYFSTHDDINPRIELTSNYVFPVKALQKTGLCTSLKNSFLSTDALPWQLVDKQQFPNMPALAGVKMKISQHLPTVDYHVSTFFGKAERACISLQLKKI